jgi:hypothetical protein
MAALSMVLAGWWLVTTAWDRAYPPAAAEVTDFRIESDTKINVTFTVDRPNPSVAVTCRVVAQASDLQVVGEQAVPVPPADDRKIDRNVTLITLRRAVLATAQDCSVA